MVFAPVLHPSRRRRELHHPAQHVHLLPVGRHQHPVELEVARVLDQGLPHLARAPGRSPARLRSTPARVSGARSACGPPALQQGLEQRPCRRPRSRRSARGPGPVAEATSPATAADGLAAGITTVRTVAGLPVRCRSTATRPTHDRGRRGRGRSGSTRATSATTAALLLDRSPRCPARGRAAGRPSGAAPRRARAAAAAGAPAPGRARTRRGAPRPRAPRPPGRAPSTQSSRRSSSSSHVMIRVPP